MLAHDGCRLNSIMAGQIAVSRVNPTDRDKRGHDGARRLSPASSHARGFQPVIFLSDGTHSMAGVRIDTGMLPNWLVIWAFLLGGFTPSFW